MSAPPDSKTVMERRTEILAPRDPSRYTTLLRLVRDPGSRVVVSLGGGSVPGLCGNIALVRLLEELGVRHYVTQVWGTSAGAAIGGPWATGTPAARILSRITAMNHRGVVDVTYIRLILGFFLLPFGRPLPDGLVRGRHFSAAVKDCLSVDTFEESPLPFRCIACTDDGRNRRKVFRRGPLLPAILSSMAIPGIVLPRPPEPGEQTGFFDGGLVEKTPLISPIADHNRTDADKKLLILGTHFGNEARTGSARGFPLRFLNSINALEDLAWSYQLSEARQKPNVLLIILNPRIDDPSFFDFSRIERNYLHAREALSDALQNAKLALSFGIR
jgi:predicted acylesterase/phospholipase RssA